MLIPLQRLTLHMKYFSSILFLSLLTFSFNSFAQTKELSQKLTFIQPYCGGARPTAQMEEDAKKPKPYAHKTIIIISEKGKIDSVKTDGEGTFKKIVKYGKYKLYESWRYYKKTPDGSSIVEFDSACLKKEWKKEFKIITITKEKITEEIKFELIEKCPSMVPCVLEKYIPNRIRP